MVMMLKAREGKRERQKTVTFDVYFSSLGETESWRYHHWNVPFPKTKAFHHFKKLCFSFGGDFKVHLPPSFLGFWISLNKTPVLCAYLSQTYTITTICFDISVQLWNAIRHGWITAPRTLNRQLFWQLCRKALITLSTHSGVPDNKMLTPLSSKVIFFCWHTQKLRSLCLGILTEHNFY